ncbi:MAG: crotonyl-CoA carboxylase/reductase [Chloroflexi bacterium]|nr:crotonyl-CoA carboxylase/reductase [Chloroflexota bacterium]|tara:strand:- start:1193 stop:2416 length:1224 start_codon:yes stop_codon:yes gene_type:complete
MMVNEIYELGDQPPIGSIPKMMHAQTIRQSRYGEPKNAIQSEIVPVPDIGPDEVLVYVMASSVNYNNVWAALGTPVDIVAQHQRVDPAVDYHIGGSDASGIVYAVGDNVAWPKVGDRVVVHSGWWDKNDPYIIDGGDPMCAPSARVWGYDVNWGAFAQYCRVQSHMCMPMAEHLSWAEAAVSTLDGATAYRMLLGWSPHTVREDDVVLVWGGAGGLGCYAIQIVKNMGGIPIAVVSSDDRGEYCTDLGAAGYINRKHYDHWGVMPDWRDENAYSAWLQGARDFGRAIWDILGERRSPRIVFEHPGEMTMPTSVFVCDTAGMVVICAGTTGYNAVSDLRYLWTRQKRIQGSHCANDEQAVSFNDMMIAGQIDPCVGEIFAFEDTAKAHQMMYEGVSPPGKMAILVNAS